MSNDTQVLNADVPSLVLDYFGHPQEEVKLVQAFNQRSGGWVALVPRPGTWKALFASARVGATAFGFRTGDRIADFSLEELEKYARRPLLTGSLI